MIFEFNGPSGFRVDVLKMLTDTRVIGILGHPEPSVQES